MCLKDVSINSFVVRLFVTLNIKHLKVINTLVKIEVLFVFFSLVIKRASNRNDYLINIDLQKLGVNDKKASSNKN